METWRHGGRLKKERFLSNKKKIIANEKIEDDKERDETEKKERMGRMEEMREKGEEHTKNNIGCRIRRESDKEKE